MMSMTITPPSECTHTCTHTLGLSTTRRVFLIFAASYVIIVAVVRLLLEMFQFVTLRLSFLLDWVNWAEVILFSCSIIFVFVYGTDCLCPTEWQWQIGSIAVFLSWIDLIIIFRKIPLTGWQWVWMLCRDPCAHV
jgi:hypothetical protein